MKDCLFCKIIKGEIPSTKVYENDYVYAFKDINPMAKDHFLFISKKHTKNVSELIENNPEDLLHLHQAINEFTKTSGLAKTGYRIVTNVGDDGGQTVFHTHFHVLGGEQLRSFGA